MPADGDCCCGPVEWYAALLLEEKERHRRLRRNLSLSFPLTAPTTEKKVGAVGGDGTVSLTHARVARITAEWSSAVTAREDVVQYICGMPGGTDDLLASIVAIQTEKLRHMEEMYLLLEAAFKRQMMCSGPGAAAEIENEPLTCARGSCEACASDGGLLAGKAAVCGTARLYLSAVPVLLDLCDAMDTCISACQSTRQQVQLQKRVVCEAVGVLALKRRRTNLKMLFRMLKTMKRRHDQTRCVDSLLEAGHFAEALQLLDGLRLQGGNVLCASTPVGSFHENEGANVEGMCGATVLGAAILEKHHFLCSNGASVVGAALRSYLFHLLGALLEEPDVWPDNVLRAALCVVRGARALCSRGETAAFISFRNGATFNNNNRNNNSHAMGSMTPGRLIEMCIVDELYGVVRRCFKATSGDIDGVMELASHVPPLEVRRSTLLLVSQLSSFLRAVFTLQRFFETLFSSAYSDVWTETEGIIFEGILKGVLINEFPTGTALKNNDSAPVSSFSSVFPIEAYESCCGIGLHAVKEALQVVQVYHSYLPLESVTLMEVLLTCRLLLQFVDVCRPVLPVGSGLADDATTNVEARLAFLVRQCFAGSQADTLCQLLRSDTGRPVGATEADFPPLYVLVPCKESRADAETAATYLVVPPGRLRRDDGDAVVRYVLRGAGDAEVAAAPNPFFAAQTALQEARPADTGQRLRLLAPDDGVGVLTFSSLMVVKMMTEAVAYAQVLRRTALALLGVNLTLMSVFVWYIVAYFVSSDNQWLASCTSADAKLKQFAAHLRTSYIPHSFQWDVLESSPCLAWKSVANSRPHLFAAVERATGLCSVTTVAFAFKATLTSLGPLLPAEQLDQVAVMKESMGRLCNFVSQHGLRVLSSQLLSPESLAGSMEELNWNDVAKGFPTAVSQVRGSSSFSAPVRQAVDALLRCQKELRELYRDVPSVSMKRLLDHVMLNVVTGFVEGVSRIRRLCEFGAKQLMHDAEYLCQEIFRIHPTLTRHPIANYVQRYTSVMTSCSGAAELVSTAHSLYTTRQLMALIAREYASKRKEMEQLIARIHPRDVVPVCLIEESF
ncbi:hypothetical protein DQ04_12381000 [Trypanosoma grayi]|uniref:hypothetical protein n=1 Tax=Trypanosoma grayi TaxID=71804 RepID=UPI0004F41A62|nr:hypothetical protein DQ04_12381000 [Trypanosoma grayi]KEG06760.1 hypothetical protein DQ04_12381000 [Trypanosoma grayi]